MTYKQEWRLLARLQNQSGKGKRRRQKRFLGNYRCELCYAPFYRQRDLEEHMELTHGPAGKEMIIKSVTCEICKKKLKTRRLLARHKFKGGKCFIYLYYNLFYLPRPPPSPPHSIWIKASIYS
jgi:hypothetical protein